MPAREAVPYQLKMFHKSLKKRQKVQLLCRHLGSTTGKACLLLTCGDNNGAMNYRFREHGGNWTWADADPGLKAEMEQLLGEAVHHVDTAALPFADHAFDAVVAIDVHEHLPNPAPFTAELNRVARPGAKVVVTVPNGNPRKLAVRLKRLLGMTPSVYGHERWGFDIEELSAMLRDGGLQPVASSSYSRFFTEMVELAINFVYVKVLSRKNEAGDSHAIAPGSEHDLRRVRKSYRIYALAYPVLRALSALDALIPFRRGYAVVVEARSATAPPAESAAT